MSLRRTLGSAFLILSVSATAGLADHKDKHHKPHGHEHRQEHRQDQRRADRYDYRQEAQYREWKRQQRQAALRADREEAAYREWQRKQNQARQQWQRGCPQGLVAVEGECLRPANARRNVNYQVGDRFQGGNYNPITNPSLYNLQQQAGMQYYSDNNSIYQVDKKTQKIMAVMNLMQMMNAMGGLR